MSDETYMGYANRETWAFCLHINNDQGLYNETIELAQDAQRRTRYDADEWTDQQLGELVVNHWRDELFGGGFGADQTRMILEDVGSFWRIDYAEVGANVREMIENG